MSNLSSARKLVPYLPGLLCLMLFVAYGFGDYWVVGVIANPDEVARYNFGAEAMIAQGGDKYRSANAYAMASFIIGMLSSMGLVVSIFVLFKSRHKALLKAYCAAALTLLVVVFVGHAW